MLENNHFVIYENAMYNESFETDIMNGAYTVEQLKVLFSEDRLTPEQLRIFKENVSCSGKYSKELVEELFNSAPKQRGLFKRGMDKVSGALGSTKGATNSKLTGIYYKVWDQYKRVWAKSSAMGQEDHTLGLAKQVLKNTGVSDAALNETHANNFNTILDDDAVSKEDVGEFIYNALKTHYRTATMSAPQTNFRIPGKL